MNEIARQIVRAALFAVLVLTGRAPWAADIVVGQVGPMSGLDAGQGRAYAAGMQLFFNAVNKGGGVNGNGFQLVRSDDAGRPETTVAATRALLAEHRPAVLAGFFGSRNIDELVGSGLLDKERIALVGYRAADLRADTPYLFGVHAGLRDELQKLMEHMAVIGLTRIGLFHEETPGAAALVAAAEEAARKANATIVARAGYPTGTLRVSPAVEALSKAAPQAIVMVASGAAAASFIEQYRAGGGAAQLFAHSGADVEQLSKRLPDELLRGVAIVQVTPSPYKISIRLTKEFNDHVAAAPNLEAPVSFAMMEGYITAKVIVEAVRRAGPRAGRAGVLAALESMESYDLGGYVVGYRPNARSGSRFVELSIVSGTGRIRQ